MIAFQTSWRGSWTCLLCSWVTGTPKFGTGSPAPTGVLQHSGQDDYRCGCRSVERLGANVPMETIANWLRN